MSLLLLLSDLGQNPQPARERIKVRYLKRFLDYEKKRSDLEPDESES